VLIQYSGELSELENRLIPFIKKTLGNDFAVTALDGIFQDNINALRSMLVYPLFMISIISIIGIYTLFNYQKAGLVEKIHDFSIIRAIGAKYQSIRRILFFESLFILIPSSLISLALGMIVNSLFLIDPISLPSIYVPFSMMGLIFVLFLALNLIGLRSILKKIKTYSIKEFTIV
jgi:ABC-type antimicrobial peptide transport system permease subunit